MDSFELVRHYTSSILALVSDLRMLEEDPGNLDLLRALQSAIAVRIKLAERRAKAAKGRTRSLKFKLRGNRPSKQVAVTLKRQIAAAEETLASYRYMAFVWRCFGDGIAFLYLDKYALKHVYFDTTSYLAKQDPGDLAGKSGFALEWGAVKHLLRDGIPAMLCDLTNTLRHGDVCILIGPDPQLVEVKSSSNSNVRIERQLESIARISDFLRRDEARDFRGVPHVVRTALGSAERNHFAVIEQCIKDSGRTGAAACTPEPGLHYVCVRDPAARSAILGSVLSGPRLVASLLNEAKTERIWMPNYPFTLSIRDPSALFDFIQGSVSIFVAVDLDTVKRKFAEFGLQVAFVPEGPWAF